MKNIYSSITELIGNTPLLEVKSIEKTENCKARILVKLESFNPGGSVKDRVALSMIEATLVLTPGSEGMAGAIRKAQETRDATPGAIILGQFDNPANPTAHVRTTGEEIWRDTDGSVDIFIACVGTGGTLSGTAAALKQHNPDIMSIAVEPDSSAVLSGGKPGPHKIQGIGAGFIPENYNPEVVDKVMRITDKEAVKASRLLAQKEGVLAGISSGAALAAAITEAKKDENSGKTIVAIMPDTGERYLSTELYAFDTYPTD